MKYVLFVVFGAAIGAALTSLFGESTKVGVALGAVVGIAAGIWNANHK